MQNPNRKTRYSSDYNSNYSGSENSNNSYERHINSMYKDKPPDYPFDSLQNELKYFKDSPFKQNESYINLEYIFTKCLDSHIKDDAEYNYWFDVHHFKKMILYPLRKTTTKDLIAKFKTLQHNLNMPLYYNDHKIKLIEFVVEVYKLYFILPVPGHLKTYEVHNRKMLKQFIYYLVSNGSNLMNLKLPENVLYELRPILIKGLLEWRKKENKSIQHHSLKRKIKRNINRITGKNVSRKVTRHLPNELQKKIDEYK